MQEGNQDSPIQTEALPKILQEFGHTPKLMQIKFTSADYPGTPELGSTANTRVNKGARTLVKACRAEARPKRITTMQFPRCEPKEPLMVAANGVVKLGFFDVD